jgi:hypothetical protein
MPLKDLPVLKEANVKPRVEKIVTMEGCVRARQMLHFNPGVTAKRWMERGGGKFEVLAGFHDQKYKE